MISKAEAVPTKKVTEEETKKWESEKKERSDGGI